MKGVARTVNYFDLLKSNIKESGMSLSEISEALKLRGHSVSKGYISQLQNGKTDNPATESLTRSIAEIIGADAEKLLWAATVEKAPHEIADKMKRLKKLEELKEEYSKSLSVKEINISDPNTNLTKVPVLGSIAAGQPIDRIEYIEDIEYVPTSVLRGKKAFALKVHGDSMIGDFITEGDIVICISQKEVSPSDIAVVAVDGETATIKRVKCAEDMCMLMPSNPKLQPSLVKASNIEILGKVVEVRRRF